MALLEGKIAIVTGAGNGIGREVALLLAREGASVLVNDIGCDAAGAGSDPEVVANVMSEINSAGGRALASSDSIAESSGVRSLFELCSSKYGGLDIFVHCAGIQRDKALLAFSESDLDATLAVHLKGAALCTQAAARLMKQHLQSSSEGASGSIVLTTAVSGLLGNYAQASAAAAHAGVLGLMRTASIELQRSNIRVNAVAPLAKTRQTRELPIFETVESMLPVHAAPAYLFLASGLSRDVSGIVMAVAGGRISTYRVVESAGKFKDSDSGVWRAEEIAEHFAAIRRG